MKHRFIVLLSIILLLLFASACGTTEPVTNEPGTNEPSTNEPEANEPEVNEPEVNEPEVNEPEYLQPSAILESKQALGDSTTLFYIPNETVESGLMQALHSFHNNFLVCGSNEDGYSLKLLSAKTGEELCSNIFSDIEMPNVQICGDKIALTDVANGQILILDETLQEVTNHQVTCDYNSIHLSPDCQKVYVFYPEDGLHATTFATGETEFFLENSMSLYVSGTFETNVTFSYLDLDSQFEKYASLNLETGEIQELPFPGSFFNICHVNDIWFASLTDESSRHYIGIADNVKLIDRGDQMSQVTLAPGSGHLLFTLYNDLGFEKIIAYDSTGKFVSECVNSLEGMVVQGRPFWSEIDGGYYFIMIDPTGKDMLMYWDINADCTGEDLVLEELSEEVLPEEAVSKDLYTRAKEISNTYGIQIRIAEQCFTEYQVYTMEACLDEEMIEHALDEVEKVLSVYPEGFFEQLLYGSTRKLELHLTGPLEMNNIVNDSGNGFTAFSGFASPEGACSLIVLDIGSFIEPNLHHEIFHIIDSKLAFDSLIRPESIYSEEEWSKLNPEDFEYAGQLYNLPDSFYDGKNEDWFTGYYARTDAKEDRATIMEYAGTGNSSIFVSAPHLQAKLEYLCKCIRDAFDTTGQR